MELAAAQAKYADMHAERQFHDGSFARWSDKRSASYPYRYDEGVTIGIADSDLAPHDHFLGGARECPECASGGGVPDQEEDDGGGE